MQVSNDTESAIDTDIPLNVVSLVSITEYSVSPITTDRLKPVRNYFQSVYFFIERREGTFYMLKPWNKPKYAWPSRLRKQASFVAILLSPNFNRRRASNLWDLHNTVYTERYSRGQTRWNGLKIGECVINNVINKFVHQYCDYNINIVIHISVFRHHFTILLTLQNGSDSEC